MNQILSRALKVFGGLVLLSAFASIGFASDNPRVMVPVFFLFFLAVFVLVFLYNIHRQKKKTVNPAYIIAIKKVLGSVLVLASLLTPYFFFRGAGFSASIFIVLAVITLILIALTIVAIRLIDRNNILHSAAGYILLIIICSMPAIIMMQHDRTYHALGGAYYAALVICVLAWTGISTLGKYFKI